MGNVKYVVAKLGFIGLSVMAVGRMVKRLLGARQQKRLNSYLRLPHEYVRCVALRDDCVSFDPS